MGDTCDVDMEMTYFPYINSLNANIDSFPIFAPGHAAQKTLIDIFLEVVSYVKSMLDYSSAEQVKCF